MEWTPRFKKLLNYKDCDDGKFWISYEDFCSNYRVIYLCKTVRDHVKHTMQGTWSAADKTDGGYRMQNVPVFNVKCDKACTLTAVLMYNKTKEDYEREEAGEEANKVYIGVQCYPGKGTKQSEKLWNRSKLIAESQYRVERVSVEFDVDVNQWVRVACVTYEKGQQGAFTLSLFSNCDVLVVNRVANAD